MSKDNTDQTQQLELDFSALPSVTWGVTGHSDSFSISSNNTNTVWVSPGASAPSWTFTDWSATTPPQSKLTLTGDDADIEINGESVVSMLREIRDRLNILQVSKEMEQEWTELRILREQYQAKLAECQEKSQIWRALKDEN